MRNNAIKKVGASLAAEAALFRVLGDPTRLRLAVLLAWAGETCVCRLAEALEVQNFNVSRHLAVLRNAGLVEARREGTWMYYRLSEPGNRLEECLYTCFRECLIDSAVVREDRRRLREARCNSSEPVKKRPRGRRSARGRTRREPSAGR